MVCQREKPHREYIADQERLLYTNSPPLPQTSVFTMRLGEKSAGDLSSDEESNKKSFVLLHHSPRASSQALVAAAHTKPSRKAATKYPTRQILQKKISKEERHPAPKIQQHDVWEPLRVEEVEEDAEPIDKNVEVVDAILKNEKVETPKSGTFTKSKDKKSKVLTHLFNSVDPGETAQQIFSG